MTQITILVDQIFPDLEKIITPGEVWNDSNAPGPNGPNWLVQNTRLLFYWSRSKEFNIVPVSEFDSSLHPNPYYLINGSGPSVKLYQLMSIIPNDSIPIIQKYKIPILIFYPLEYASDAISEKWLSNFCDIRDAKNLKDSMIKILTLGPLYDKHSNQKTFYDFFPKLKERNIEFVESIGWLDFWNSTRYGRTIFLPSTNMQFELNGRTLTLADHNIENKKKLFLCLNNRPRGNRMMLLLAIHANRRHIKDFIVSQRFHMKPGDVIFLLRGLFRNMSNNYSDYKNDFMIKLFNPEIHSNLEYLNLKNNLEKIQHPIKKFIMELYFLAKEFKIPGIKEPNEGLNIDLNHSWCKEWYNETWCSVITETIADHMDAYTNSNGIEPPIISEKTLKPILNHHPFVIFGHNYSHKCLNRHGFKTFDQSWFELPEEGIEGNQTFFERLYNLIESLKRLSSYTDEQLAQKWNLIVPDLIYNKDHLLNNNWAKVQKNLILGC